MSIEAGIERSPGSWEPRNTPSHTAQQASHKTFIEKTRRMAASALERQQQTQQDAGLMQFLGKGVELFYGDALWGGDWWHFMSRDWAFYSVVWGQGLAVRVVSVFCRWNLIEVLGEGPGYSRDLRALQSPLFGLLLISSQVMGNGVMLLLDYFLLIHCSPLGKLDLHHQGIIRSS